MIRICDYKTIEDMLEAKYEELCDFYGILSPSWDDIHCHYSPYMFCYDNRKRIIAEYLEFEDFVNDAKKYNIWYHSCIDKFLKEYHDAVYKCLNLNYDE